MKVQIFHVQQSSVILLKMGLMEQKQQRYHGNSFFKCGLVATFESYLINRVFSNVFIWNIKCDKWWFRPLVPAPSTGNVTAMIDMLQNPSGGWFDRVDAHDGSPDRIHHTDAHGDTTIFTKRRSMYKNSMKPTTVSRGNDSITRSLHEPGAHR